MEMNTLVTTGKLIHYPKSKNNQVAVAVPTPPTTPQPNGVQPVPVVKVEPTFQTVANKQNQLVLIKAWIL